MKKTIFLTLALIAATAASSLPSLAANPNVMNLKTSITDDAIVFPETFEQDTQKLLEGWYMRNYTAGENGTTAKKDVDTSDEVIRKRLAAMPTVIEMPFNSIVRQYIDRYTKNGRPQVSVILGLGSYYMPIFEQALEERGLPQELKYLPVIESALDPNAVSKHGATGLWQLMLATGKGLGLECNSLIDERRDPYASSKAAAELLKQLYDTYGDWTLAIAAYNSGPSAVNKAIRRAGGDPSKADFWSIYPYLSDETRGYVPMFIAANYVMTYYPQHNISPVLPTKPLVTDTVGVTDRMHFDQIEAVLAIPKDELRILNPQYREDVIPGSPERAYMLVLPSKQIHAYLMSREQILSYQADKYRRRTTVQPGQASDNAPVLASADTADMEADQLPAASGSPTTVSHKVVSGETLTSIAAKYGVQASDIRSANNLRRNAVRVGQVLTINGVDPAVAAASRQEANANMLAANERQQTAEASASQTQAQTRQNQQKSSASSQNGKKETTQTVSKNTKKETAQAASKKKASSSKKQKQVTHTIKSGENLGRIARKYGVTVEDIKKANGMKNDAIRAGAELKIPAKK
ncbi:MAG: LysM peptidoglycan-binding domain-containing protein [Muribaculaceae bacterium]|nr:LysM peptidoglycan-binding domain-containing protein [Muribaculaceae bacterium]